jgi:hypothetical protein
MDDKEEIAVRIANAVLVASIGLSLFLSCAGLSMLVPAVRKLASL